MIPQAGRSLMQAECRRQIGDRQPPAAYAWCPMYSLPAALIHYPAALCHLLTKAEEESKICNAKI